MARLATTSNSGGYAQYEAGGRPVSRSGEVCIGWLYAPPYGAGGKPISVDVTHCGWLYPIIGRGVIQFEWRGYQLGDYAPTMRLAVSHTKTYGKPMRKWRC